MANIIKKDGKELQAIDGEVYMKSSNGKWIPTANYGVDKNGNITGGSAMKAKQLSTDKYATGMPYFERTSTALNIENNPIELGEVTISGSKKGNTPTANQVYTLSGDKKYQYKFDEAGNAYASTGDDNWFKVNDTAKNTLLNGNLSAISTQSIKGADIEDIDVSRIESPSLSTNTTSPNFLEATNTITKSIPYNNGKSTTVVRQFPDGSKGIINTQDEIDMFSSNSRNNPLYNRDRQEVINAIGNTDFNTEEEQMKVAELEKQIEAARKKRMNKYASNSYGTNMKGA